MFFIIFILISKFISASYSSDTIFLLIQIKKQSVNTLKEQAIDSYLILLESRLKKMQSICKLDTIYNFIDIRKEELAFINLEKFLNLFFYSEEYPFLHLNDDFFQEMNDFLSQTLIERHIHKKHDKIIINEILTKIEEFIKLKYSFFDFKSNSFDEKHFFVETITSKNTQIDYPKNFDCINMIFDDEKYVDAYYYKKWMHEVAKSNFSILEIEQDLFLNTEKTIQSINDRISKEIKDGKKIVVVVDINVDVFIITYLLEKTLKLDINQEIGKNKFIYSISFVRSFILFFKQNVLSHENFISMWKNNENVVLHVADYSYDYFRVYFKYITKHMLKTSMDYDKIFGNGWKDADKYLLRDSIYKKELVEVD